ncbi:hypothetical protein [Lacipirellula parvula]|nr:hypothetical protein [Lacipirellula parvula]
MKRFTVAEIVVASALVASAISAMTCIMPSSVIHAHAEWTENPTPETEAAYRQEASRWHLREHAAMAAQLSVGFIVVGGLVNFLLPPRPKPAPESGG